MSLDDSQALPIAETETETESTGARALPAPPPPAGVLPSPKAIAEPPEGNGPATRTTSPENAPEIQPPAPEDAAEEAPVSRLKDVPPQNDIYGLIDLGGRILGIQAVHVREAVPFPDDISPMAVSLPGLLGAMVLRQDTIPLVDMAVMLGVPTDLPIRERVVIIVNDASHQRLLGLVVDRLQGMTSLDFTNTAEMCVVGRDHLLVGGRSFVNDGTVVGILDPQLLFDQPSLPYAIQRERTAARSNSLMFGDQQAYLLCSYSGHGIAFPVQDIHATIPTTPLCKSPMTYGACDGVIEHHGIEIPLLDTLQILGLGRNASRPERSASLAMRVPKGGLIAFEVDRFFDIVHTRTEDLLEMPQVLTTRHDLFSGIHMSATGDHYLVLHAECVLQEEAVVQLASTTVKDTEADATQETEDKHTRTGNAAARAREAENALYLISQSAKKRMATQLAEIVEILRLPPSLLAAEVRYDGYMGTLSHRSQLVPIFSVSNVLGAFPFYQEGKACVLLFRMEGQLYGAVVDELEAVSRCHPVGAPEDRVLRKMDNGEFLPSFELIRELPVNGGGGGAFGGMSSGFDAGELF